jgi:2'-5' RNA ligase
MVLMELMKQKQPTYVAVKLDKAGIDQILKIAQGLDNKINARDIHITVAYSRTPISLTALGVLEPPVRVRPKHYSIFNTQTGEKCLVLEVESEGLVARHNEIMKEYGASYDFPVYKPHITLSYNCGVGFDLKTLPDVKTLTDFKAVEEYAMTLDVEYQPA